MDIKGRISSYKESAEKAEQESQARKEPWQRKLADLVSTEDGWRDLLGAMAEHPGWGGYNLYTVANYRHVYDVHDTQELLSFEGAKELGGNVRRGAKAMRLVVPDGEGGFKYENRFPASACENLPDERYHQRPMHADPNNSATMEIFTKATDAVDLSSLTQVQEYAFAKRYGLSTADDELPGLPLPKDPTDPEKGLADAITEESRGLGEVCRKLDQEIKYQRHPEWRRQDWEEQNAEPDAAPAHQQAAAPQQRPFQAAYGAARQAAHPGAQQVVSQAQAAYQQVPAAAPGRPTRQTM